MLLNLNKNNSLNYANPIIEVLPNGTIFLKLRNMLLNFANFLKYNKIVTIQRHATKFLKFNNLFRKLLKCKTQKNKYEIL